jgi:hypothetical protein
MAEGTPKDWPVFPDCALPDACECAARVRPEYEWTSCRVPEINATARRFGWGIPYPDALARPEMSNGA